MELHGPRLAALCSGYPKWCLPDPCLHIRTQGQLGSWNTHAPLLQHRQMGTAASQTPQGPWPADIHFINIWNMRGAKRKKQKEDQECY